MIHLLKWVILYDQLRSNIAEQGVSTYTLIHKYNINPRTIHNLKHNKSIKLFTLERLCQILNYQAESIVVFSFGDENNFE